MGAQGALRLRLARSTAVLAVACVAGGLLVAGCSASGSSPAALTPTIGSPSAAPTSNPIVSPNASPSAPKALGCKVGVSWNLWNDAEFGEVPAVNAVLDREGAIYTTSDAKGSVEYQESDIDAFVAAKMGVIIVRRQHYGTVSAAVNRATDAGTPVIVENNLLESPNVLWVGYDPAETGRMEARAALAARPTGNYAIIDGHPGDPYAEVLRRGVGEVLQPALDSGAIKIVGETYTENQDPVRAKNEMDAILKKNSNRIDAVIVEDDLMATGVIQSLKEAGLEGKVAVSAINHGYDPTAPGLRNVALGVQTADVWQDFTQLGKTAAEAAMELCRDRDLAKITGTTRVTSPGGLEITSILLTPKVITRDNLNVALEQGWTTKDALCRGVGSASAPAACR
jgi:D-xylose transport system substrate-binding protein